MQHQHQFEESKVFQNSSLRSAPEKHQGKIIFHHHALEDTQQLCTHCQIHHAHDSGILKVCGHNKLGTPAIGSRSSTSTEIQQQCPHPVTSEANVISLSDQRNKRSRDMVCKVYVQSHKNPERKGLRKTWKNYVPRSSEYKKNVADRTNSNPVSSHDSTIASQSVASAQQSLTPIELSKGSHVHLSQQPSAVSTSAMPQPQISPSSSFHSFLPDHKLYPNRFLTNQQGKSESGADENGTKPVPLFNREYHPSTPMSPPPSVESQIVTVNSNPGFYCFTAANVDSKPMTMKPPSTHSVSSKTRYQDGNNSMYMVTPQSQAVFRGGDADIKQKAHCHAGVNSLDPRLKSTGTSPIMFENMTNSQHMKEEMLYHKHFHTQQKEIKKIIRREINQVRQMMESFGERLEKIHLTLKETAELNKTQTTETSTTNVGASVKMSKKEKREQVNQEPSKHTRGKLLNRELFKTATGNPKTKHKMLSSKNVNFVSSPNNKSMGKKTLVPKTPNVSQNEEFLLEDETPKSRKVQKTASQKSNQNFVEHFLSDVWESSCRLIQHEREEEKKEELKTNCADESEMYTKFVELPNRNANEKEHNERRKQKRSCTDNNQNNQCMNNNGDCDSCATSFQYQHPVTAKTSNLVTHPAMKLDNRKFYYISPMASRPVSSEYKLPSIPETDEISIHCGSSRDSEKSNSCYEQNNQKHFTVERTVTDGQKSENEEMINQSILKNKTSPLSFNQDSSPVERDDLQNQSEVKKKMPRSERKVRRKQMRGTCTGDKLDEKIMMMRKEIIELKHRILMLQRTQRVQGLEQGGGIAGTNHLSERCHRLRLEQ